MMRLLKIKKRKFTLFVLYGFVCVLSFYLMVINHPYKFEVKAIPTLILIGLYLIETKKYTFTFLVFLISNLIGDAFTSVTSGFNIGIVSYGIAYLMLIYHLRKLIKKENHKLFVIYLTLFGFLFSIVYLFVLNDPGDAMLPIIFYGICICSVTSFLLINYIKSMEYGNFILLIAIGFRIISDSIYAIVLFSKTDVYFDVFSLSTLLISNFMFYRGFVFNEQKLTDFFERL